MQHNVMHASVEPLLAAVEIGVVGVDQQFDASSGVNQPLNPF
jgi:hypothetical protein